MFDFIAKFLENKNDNFNKSGWVWLGSKQKGSFHLKL